MLWLFGQIWLWLLIAFALGAGLTALVLTGARRRPRQEEPGELPSRPLAAEEPAPAPPPVNPPLAAEETQQIPVPTEDTKYEEADDRLPPDHGHAEGTLPPRREWHERNEWPDEQDVVEKDERRPRRSG